MFDEPWHNPMPDSIEVPEYMKTEIWSPRNELVIVPDRLHDRDVAVYGSGEVQPGENDLVGRHDGMPQGEYIILTGRVTDSWGKPVADTLVEIWQANASGRYIHFNDPKFKPADPNFTGAGRVMTDKDGRYTFKTIKPGAYPWWRDPRAWRASHIHFSLSGRSLVDRVITQMMFPGDPLLALDPIYLGVRDEKARDLLIGAIDWDSTVPEHAIGYRFDIVLGGANPTPLED